MELSSKTGKLHNPHPVMGFFRIHIEDIPSESCYNYLASAGVSMDSFGEIFLSEDEAKAYLNFQIILMEE